MHDQGREWRPSAPWHFFGLIESEAGRHQTHLPRKGCNQVRNDTHIHWGSAVPEIATD